MKMKRDNEQASYPIKCGSDQDTFHAIFYLMSL